MPHLAMTAIKQTIATALLLTATQQSIGNNRHGHLLAVSAQSPNPRPTSNTLSHVDRDGNRDRDHTGTTCPQVASLHCKNGSTCEPGIASFGSQHDHLGLQTHESGYYCKCLPGYIGHECTIQVDDCDGDSGYNPSDPTGVLTSCYHGATCKSSGNKKSFYCDCKEVNSDTGPTATKFAGLMCQHESTGLCASSLAGEVAPNHQFCTNHGHCVKMVTGGEPHPGCVCRDGWAGDHCELREDPLMGIQQSSSGKNETAGKILFSFMMITMGLVSIAIGGIFVQARRQQQATTNAEAGGGVEIPPPQGNGIGFEKTKVGAGDLEADGSGTLGKLAADGHFVIDDTDGDAHDDDVDEHDDDGDLELTEHEENSAPAESEKPEIV